MGVLVCRENAKLAAQGLPAERGFRQHAVNRFLDDALRVLVEHLGVRRETLVAHVAGVMEVALLLTLAAGDANLGCVDDNYIVTGVHMRRVHRLVLAANDLRDFRCEAAEDHSVGVYDVPIVLDVCGSGAISLHEYSSVCDMG